MENYYGEVKEQEVIFDTNRLWCSRMPLLSQLSPESKVIACVRDIPWIMDSIERLLQRNPFDNSKLFSTDSERSTIYSRMAALSRHDRLIGFPWAALKEAYFGPFSDKLLIVEYNLLARAPEKVLKLIYEFIDQPWFENHDFENVEFDTPDFDDALGLSGLHKIRNRVELVERSTIIPPDIFEKYADMAFWRSNEASLSSVIKPAKNK